MPPSKKRKLVSEAEMTPETQTEKNATASEETPTTAGLEVATEELQSGGGESILVDKANERREKFKALQARAVGSNAILVNDSTYVNTLQRHAGERNLKEQAAEAQRQSIDPNLLASLGRKQAIASHKLLKADTAADGEDFERKRAWDWTVEESEKWDKRMSKKEKHREDVAFQDYRQDARKIYKRHLRDLQPDMEGYEREKAAAVQKAAMSGGLEIVETEDGELAAVDKNGTFYSTADSTDFVENKPQKTAVDRLVSDIKKAEEVRLKKRRDRGKGEEEGDITYINDKNKQFNQKLARFYNKVRTHPAPTMTLPLTWSSIPPRSVTALSAVP